MLQIQIRLHFSGSMATFMYIFLTFLASQLDKQKITYRDDTSGLGALLSKA